MTTKLLVGNDIVHLENNEGANRHLKRSFVHRILCDREIKDLDSCQSPSTRLWQYWAAKEACYKLLKKVDSSIIFSPAQISVRFHSDSIESDCLQGSAQYQQQKIFILWETKASYTHATAINATPTTIEDVPQYLSEHSIHYRIDNLDIDDSNVSFSPEELISIHSPDSRKVRVQLKKLLSDLGQSEIEVIRERAGRKWAPPTLWQRGEPRKKWDLSLSHDGPYFASIVSMGQKWC